MPVLVIGLDAVQRKLEGVKDRLKNLQPILDVVASDLVTLADDSFRNQASPSGAPWAPLSQTTLAKRQVSADAGRLRALRRAAREHDARGDTWTTVEFSDTVYDREGNAVGLNTGTRMGMRRATRRRRSRAQLESEFGSRVISANGITILVDTGRLRASITARASRSGIRIGSNVRYAMPHQFGAMIQPWGRGYTRPLPARPFLPVNRGGDMMTGGPASVFWARVNESVRRYILTGEVR